MITIDPPRSHPSFALPKAALARFLERVREAVGLQGQIDVVLADDTTLRRLNRSYRGKNKPTDVLSFPAVDTEGSEGNAMAGDLAISLDIAARQAAEHGHTLRDEVRVLLLHGTLHLAGYDHETDSGEMAERETELRNVFRLPSALIARAEDKAPETRKRPTPLKRRTIKAASGPPSKASGEPRRRS